MLLIAAIVNDISNQCLVVITKPKLLLNLPIGSITSAALAALSFQEGQQRPHSALDSAMSGRHRNMSGTKTGTGR